MSHFIGIDVGTGSARACVINEQGDILAVASKDISIWQPQTGYYVRYVLVKLVSTVGLLRRNNLRRIYGGQSANL
jgi:ribulose kinase